MRWVRPALILMGFSVVSWGFIVGKIDPVAYFGLVTGGWVWWFKSRDDDKTKSNGVGG